MSRADRQELRQAVKDYIHGLRGPRQNPVTFAQINRQFAGTPESELRETVFSLCDAGEIRIVRTGLRYRGKQGYAYEIS